MNYIDRKIWAIDWLDTTAESGDYSDTYFKELTQLFAYSNKPGLSKRMTIEDGELEACNKALVIAKFLLQDAGYKLFRQSEKTEAGYQFFKETIEYEINWDDPNNAYEMFAEIMRKRAEQEQLSREYYGDCYGYDFYLGKVRKKFQPPIPEELVEMVMPYARIET